MENNVSDLEKNTEKHEETIQEEKKKKKKRNIWKTIMSLPKVIRMALFVMVFVILGLLIINAKVVTKSGSRAIKFGLENVGKLVTQTAHVTEIANIEKNREIIIKIPFTTSRLIFTVQVDVDAYVDFDKVTYVVDDSSKSITVTLPHSELDEAKIIDESLEVILDEESIFSRIDYIESNENRIKLKEDAVEKAKKNGLLEAADNNAKTIIEKFVKSDSNYANYNVFFKYLGEN